MTHFYAPIEGPREGRKPPRPATYGPITVTVPSTTPQVPNRYMDFRCGTGLGCDQWPLQKSGPSVHLGYMVTPAWRRASCEMAKQLSLLAPERQNDWQLDEHTREIGRLGVARAKAVLASCQHPRESGRCGRQ